MIIAEKLRFLADRTEDGRAFYISTFTNPYFINEAGFIHTKDENGFVHETAFKISTLLEYSISLKKPITFTEDEKAILRNLPNDYQWIARDKDKTLIAYTDEPTKQTGIFDGRGEFADLTMFKHLFKSIRWSDDEPCEFRKYL